MFYEFTLALISLGCFIVMYFKSKYKYWEKRGIPYIEPSIPFGNNKDRFTQKRPSYEALRDQYNHFKSEGHKHGGSYAITTPTYIPVDPDLIRCILAKDFGYFTDRGLPFDDERDPLNGHLFNLEGQKWRSARTKITPTFTSGKMKKMFQALLDCGDQLKEHIDVLCSQKNPLDVKDILSSFTADVIGSCAFGIDCNSFKEPDSEFREHGRQLFASTLSRNLRLLFMLLFPNLSKRFGVPFFEPKITNFYYNVIKDVVRHREENNVKRDDYLDILLELKNNKDGVGFTLTQVAAQSFGFIIAGFETSSSTMTFCLYELARNPDIQEKLREEIDEMLDASDGKLSYDGIMQLNYMEQVIDESLRKYPVIPRLMRKCIKDYKIPDTDIVLEKGKRAQISVLGLHYDSEYYPDPEKFDPDRFTPDKKAARHPYTYLPFGEGPRMCLGMRFAMMQMRIVLTLLLKNYKIGISPKMRLPLKMDPKNLLLAPLETIWLEAEKI